MIKPLFLFSLRDIVANIWLYYATNYNDKGLTTMANSTHLIEKIRSASRMMVRELGFMNATLAATDYSPSAVHALLEIESNETMTAARLAQALCLEKSSVSRMLGKLIKAGEIEESSVDGDGRFKQLRLTAKGQRTVEEIHAYGRTQVETAMQRLNPAQQQAVAQGISCYASGTEVSTNGRRRCHVQ